MAQSRPGDPGRRGDPAGRFGSTVAGRYRLDEPRHGDLPGAERWTATDQILARRVTVTLVTGPRAAAVLDAARRAALVVDPRLARILDVGTADGTGYVVTEAVDGRSIAELAARAPLAPDQARAVVGEAAAALEVARRRGVHHLALRPEAVVLTSGSRVVVEGLAVDGELLDAAGGGAHAMSRTDTVGLVRVLYAALTGRWPAAATTTTAAVPTFDEWAAESPDAPSAPVDPGLPAAPDHDGSPAAPADLVPGVPADLDTLCVVTLGPHDDGPHSPGELVRELEPWRAVRADEVFRAADSGRWPALTDSPAPPRPDGGTPTGTTTAPPTGSSPMSDDEQPTSPTPDGDTPAEGSPAAKAGRTAGRTAGGGAAAAGGAAGAAAATGTTAGATGAGAGPASGVGAASATGAAATTAAGAGAGAAAGTAAAGTGVARQSVRSAFGAAQGPGTRRPGTPPPAVPVGPRTSGPASDGPSDAPGDTPPSVPPARSGSAAEPAPAAGPDMPPAIPPAGRGASSGDREASSTAPRPGTAPAAGDREARREQDDPRDDRPAAGDAAVAGLAAAAASTRPEPARASAEDASTAGSAGTSGPSGPPVRRTTSAFATVTPEPQPAPEAPAVAVGATDPEPLGAADAPGGPGHPDWDLPFAADEPSRGPGQRRFDPTRWVLGLVAIGVVVGVVIAIGNVLRPWDGGGDDSAGAVPVATPTVTAPPAPEDGGDDGAGDDEEAPATEPPVIATVTTIDPSDDDGEHEELVGRLTDGDPATAWYTHTYNRPDFAGFKDAVGLVITLQQPATVSAITLDVNGSGGNVEVRSTDGANPTAGDVLAAGPLSPQTVLTLAQPTETQSIVLWFTALAQAPDGANKIEISTLSVS